MKQYAVKHSLYREALELYKYQAEQLREMTRLYADYLYEQSNYQEAAIGKTHRPNFCHQCTNIVRAAYESLGIYDEAYKSYQIAHRWRESLYCALMVPLSQTELENHAISLATTLVEEDKDYLSAAQIQADHLKNYPAAATLFCRASRFADATRILAINGLQNRIPELVDNGLAEAMGSTTDFLADCKAQLNAQVPRIGELREKRLADPLAFFGGDPSLDAAAGGVDIPDNVSLAPTDASTAAGRTMFTRYTGGTNMTRRTSKTRRREERKRAAGRKGTVYEEEYLVNSVRRLIERVNSTFDETTALIEGLLRRGMRERAVAVQKALQEVLGLCSSAIGEVFDAPAEEQQQKQPEDTTEQAAEQTGLAVGGDATFLESIYAGQKRAAPVMKEFKKLALLG